LRVILFEDQIKNNWDTTLADIYEYLGLDKNFRPTLPSRPVHRSWGWTRILFNYYAGKVSKRVGYSQLGAMLDRFAFLAGRAIKVEDIEFLRSVYLPEKEELAALTSKSLSCWYCGESMLRKLQEG
jgi:hypothetical protein